MKKRRGVTLIEMMIAISMSSLVFLIVSSMMMTIINSNTKSRSKEGFEQVKNDLHAEFTNRIRWGDVVEIGVNSLTADGVAYTLASGRILKDGEPVTPENVEVTAFEVKNLSTTPLFVSVEIIVDLQSGEAHVDNDSLRLVVSQRQTTINR